jgi:hypothetical protein
MMRIEVTRDSVAAGDDIDGLHQYWLDMPSGASVARVVDAVLRAPYLPSTVSGRATWVLSAGPWESGEPVAVVALQWSSPRYLVDPAREFTATALYCHYWAQYDPDAVYEAVHHPTGPPSVERPGDLPDARPTGGRWWL